MITPMTKGLTPILNQFEGIGIEKLNRVRLLKRSDTKFVFSKEILPNLLSKLTEQYKILRINSVIEQEYETQYYDTPNRDFYLQHHNGYRSRFKIRERKYCNTNEVFFEVKSKNNKNKTNKKRLKINEFAHPALHSQTKTLIEQITPFPAKNLELVLTSNFKRITLVCFTPPQRVTIDYDLSFSHVPTGKISDLKNTCIIEIKKNREHKTPFLFETLKTLGVRKSGFSKYCIGLISFERSLKQNRFKYRQLQYKKLIS